MKSSRPFQSVIGKSIAEFLSYKRTLGRKFAVEETALRLLDRYLVEKKVSRLEQITAELLEKFLASRPRPRPRSYNHLLCTVSRLLNWMVVHEQLGKSPLRVRPKRNTGQRRPYIFDPPSAKRLLSVAGRFEDRPKAPMRGKTYHAIFAILFGLGLRVGEVSRLTIGDVDFERKLLVIRESKFYKSRLVPFGPKIQDLLRDFLAFRRAKMTGLTNGDSLFSFSQNRPVHPCTISQTFHHLVPSLNLAIPPGMAYPRLHDLRHSFAVNTLLRWYRSDVDPTSRLLHLSTFLGHVDVMSTAVYLTATDELLQEANRRFEAFAETVTKKMGAQ